MAVKPNLDVPQSARADGSENNWHARTASWQCPCGAYRTTQGNLLSLHQGTLYPVLLRLGREGAVTSEWRLSENRRGARFFRLARAGYTLLDVEVQDRKQTAAIIAHFLEVKAEDFG